MSTAKGSTRVTRTRYVAQAGLIAAVYAGATFALSQVGWVYTWGPVQLRVTEALTVLAALTPAAIPGLWLGAALANLSTVSAVGALGFLDVVLGSLGSLLGAMWTWRFRRNTALALAGPVVANALIVPAYLPVLMKALGILDAVYKVVPGVDPTHGWLTLYLFGVVGVGLGEALVVYGLGWPLLVALRRLRLPGLSDEWR
jgi:uncharacterized membrane protein